MASLGRLEAGRDEILRTAERHGARNLRVFDAAAWGVDGSGVDLLVDWEPGRNLLDHVDLVADLQRLLGSPVHLGTERSLHWCVRNRILGEARAL